MDYSQLISVRREFQGALHEWYRRNRRPLPWREQPSLYKTVVSEFMLQQTQVATVLPYFSRWLDQLPNFAALAAAPESKVMKLWEGLGYYSRARNLHRLAQTVAALPSPPSTREAWSELPGIGPYTAAAVTSIAFGASAACVDGNVVRILARLVGESRLFRDGSAAAKHFTPLADALITDSDPGEHNQAMMELGATVCLRRKPLCLVCPVAAFCRGRDQGEPERLPRLQPKTIEQRTVTRAWCERRGELLLRRTSPGARQLAGLHELPETSDLALKKMKAGSLLAERRRAITRFQIVESIYRVELTVPLAKIIARHAGLEWVPFEQIDSITLSGPHKRWIREILAAKIPST